MIKSKHLPLAGLLVLLFSCKNEQGNSYAIKDFRKSLQPFLIEIASKGIVTYHDSSQNSSITDDELIRISKSENPVLRATAFSEMLDRSSFNHFNVIMSHLDDTAIVPVDRGEFGIWFLAVSDNILQKARWKTIQEKDSTIEQVLTKHNYLQAAYTILNRLEPQEKYYRYIKDMATRPRRLDPYNGYELSFDEIEYALYGLARFRKKEDIQIIKNQLMKHAWELSDVSFRLMKEFPDTAYFDVLKSYHDSQFYHFSGNRPHGFTGVIADKASPEDFIGALVIQQNDRSARLLDSMLLYLPRFTCMPDKENIINEVIEEIWKHPCPAYAKLREKIKPRADKIIKKWTNEIEVEPSKIAIDTTKENLRWY